MYVNMWNKSAVVCLNKTSYSGLRLLHQVISPGHIKHPGSEPLTIATLGDVISETAHKYPDRVAVKSLHENISITYEELLTQADALGCALRAQGLEKGDRLGLWSHNSVSWMVACVAAARAGLISVLLNPIYEKNEISYCIKKIGIKGIVIGDTLPNRNYYEKLASLVPELRVSRPGAIDSKELPSLKAVIYAGKEKLDGTFGYHDLIKNYKNRSEITKYGADVKPDEGCIIHLTSGTTGKPKGVLDSHIGLVNNCYFAGIRNYLHEEHHNICVQVPLFHALGSIITSLASVRHGSTLTLAAPTYNVDANIKALLGERCTIITGTPTMYVDLVSALRSPPAQRLRMAMAAGAPCSPQLIREINQCMNTESVKALYGLSETTACVFQSMPNDSVDRVAETVGYIADHTEAKVVNESGETVPFGQAGELLIRGYSRMIGYWDEPEKTRECIDEDGWVHTGDKFVVTEDGYGKVVGRLKDIIVKGGENIAPKEIEDLLDTHPDIVDSQVIGVPDARLGEDLCAVIRLRAGATLTLDDVTAHCTGRIARFKIPKTLKIIDEFPKTNSGKIQKFKIKELIEEGKL